MKPPYLSVIFYLYATSETSTSNTLKALFDDKTPDQSYEILEKGNMGCQVSKGGIHAVSDYKKRCLSTTSGVS